MEFLYRKNAAQTCRIVGRQSGRFLYPHPGCIYPPVFLLSPPIFMIIVGSDSRKQYCRKYNIL